MNNLIVEWNRERGLLDTFDPALELKMLSEEAREFYQAGSFAHRLCEFSDFKFVKVGTLAKNHAKLEASTASFILNRENFKVMMDWAEEVEGNMYCLLIQEYDSLGLDMSFHTCIEEAMDVVIENNRCKGCEKVEGKVVKADKPCDPVAILMEKLI